MTLQRYSEKRLEDSFSVNVLFSEPLQFRQADVIAAIKEEFPSLGDWHDVPDSAIHDTGLVVVAALIGGGSADLKWVSLTAMPGPFPKDGHYDNAINRALGFKGGREAFNAHTSVLTITVKSKGPDLVSRFKAARLATCVSAVFAGDPTCLGVMFPSGDVFSSPEDWRKAAQNAVADEWPVTSWISYEIRQYAPAAPGGKPQSTCGSVGVAAFNGHEVSFAAAPVVPGYAAEKVIGAVTLLLACGNTFVDSDTIGDENGDERIRIRFMEEGPDWQTDSWVLIHPDSSIDEFAVFGERSRPPAPTGVDNRIHAREDHMKGLLQKDRPPTIPGERVFGKRKAVH